MQSGVLVCWRYEESFDLWTSDDVICPPNGGHDLYLKWGTYCNCLMGRLFQTEQHVADMGE